MPGLNVSLTWSDVMLAGAEPDIGLGQERRI